MEAEAEGEASVQGDDVEAEEDDDDDSSEYSEVSDSDFKENWDWTEYHDPETFTQTGWPTYQTNEADLYGHNTSAATNFDFGDEDGHSEELDTPYWSDVEANPKVKFPQFKVLENDEDAKFEVGLQFSNKKEILEAIKTFATISK